LAEGGDAADAAVAAALMLGVVHPFGSGLGGGGFAVLYRADGAALALDFRERAPAAAHRDMFLDADGAVIAKASTRGAKAAGVPGELAGLWALHQRYGKLPWARVVAPALEAARDGFVVGPVLARRLAVMAPELRGYPRLAGRFLDERGLPLPRGARLTRPKLAKTLALISAQGAAALYEGEVGRQLVAAMAADGGLITAEDLRAYAPQPRPLIRAHFHGYEILSMPPPSSGGAVIAQILGVLEGVDLKALGHNSSAYLHRLTEALKHGFADRARVMGDPDFVAVPLASMLDLDARARVRLAFRPERTLPMAAYGGRYGVAEDGGTTHLSVVDRWGNAVALTTTINTAFGAMYVAGETGILMNDQLDDFSIKPGVPNAYGLIGREANAIAPGKRPLSSMSPTIALKEGRVVLVVGASGGPTIITGTLQALLNTLVFGMDARAAVEAPRVHHQWAPNTLIVEPEIPVDVRQALRRRGHALDVRHRYNAVQLITVDAAGQAGACDPAKQGAPVGVGPLSDLPDAMEAQP
ncbi:gamma-glutamyltransferase, partial [Myxococcota bacterium]|nr:gamma-glutamyltransferase [Myxococcota bacterium]